ncbi:hypothetical protein CR513_02812, partial [Mucuna pruriens]
MHEIPSRWPGASRLAHGLAIPQPGEDLKEVQIGPNPHHKTKIGRSLDAKVEEQLIRVFTENQNAFAWSFEDVPGIDPSFLYYKLSITLGM